MRSQSRGLVMIICSLVSRLSPRARPRRNRARPAEYPAPIDVAHSRGHDGAADEHRQVAVRRLASASTVALIAGSVVVMSAERHTASAPAAAAATISTATSTPRSSTSKPWLSSSETQMSLPIEWMSPLTVAKTTRPAEDPSPSGSELLDARDGRLHRLGRDHHLRQEHLAATVRVAEALDRRRQHAADDVADRRALRDHCVDEHGRGIGVAAEHRGLERGARRRARRRSPLRQRRRTVHPRRCPPDRARFAYAASHAAHASSVRVGVGSRPRAHCWRCAPLPSPRGRWG